MMKLVGVVLGMPISVGIVGDWSVPGWSPYNRQRVLPWGQCIREILFCFQVNVIGLSVCTREAFKSMKERGVDDGHIFLISRYVVN